MRPGAASGKHGGRERRSRGCVPRLATCALLAATLLGCDSAEDRAPSLAAPDSAQAPAPIAVDTASEAPALEPEAELRAALETLLRGPTEPRSAPTWFSPATAGALRSVSIDSAGHATVDFEDLRALIPNASSSAGSAILLEELNSTVFGVDGVTSVDYQIEGSCERFWEWLQYGCQTVQRP